MPVVMPTPVYEDQRCFDFLPWAASAFADVPLPLDVDSMSFDHISHVLSRCATPPADSLPPSPLDSAVTSPSPSRCDSPNMFLELLFQQFDSCDYSSSGHSSVASTPYSSSPSSPNAATSTFSATATTSRRNSVAMLKQARRALKNGEAKPMKVKASAAGVFKATQMQQQQQQYYSAPYICASIETDAPIALAAPSISSSSSSTSSSSSSSSSKKSKALASKRDSHNISERNRRQELKTSFNTLQTIVPNLINASRAHTGTVLKETIAYIHALKQEEDRLLALKASVLHQQSALVLLCTTTA